MDDDNFLKFLKLLQPMAEQLKYGLIYSEIMNGDDETAKSLVKSI